MHIAVSVYEAYYPAYYVATRQLYT